MRRALMLGLAAASGAGCLFLALLLVQVGDVLQSGDSTPLSQVAAIELPLHGGDDDSDGDDQELFVEGRQSHCGAADEFFEALEIAQRKGWVYGKLDQGDVFYKLPLQFDEDALVRETTQLITRHGFQRKDRNNYVLLISKLGALDLSLEGPFQPIPDRLANMPYLESLLDSLGIIVGRSIFRKLGGKDQVHVHVDNVHKANSHWARRFRLHIPIISNPNVTYGSDESRIYMQPGFAYLFDNANTHFVDNKSDQDRVHLIIDTVGSVHLNKLIEQSTVYRANGEVVERPIHKIHLSKKEPVNLLFEDWEEQPLRSLGNLQDARTYIEKSIIPLLQHSKPFISVMNHAVKRWESGCNIDNLHHCQAIAQDLVKYAVCHDQPLSGSSLTLAQVLEVLVRSLLYFGCEPYYLENEVELATGADNTAALRSTTGTEPMAAYQFMPLPGTSYRVPQCPEPSPEA